MSIHGKRVIYPANPAIIEIDDFYLFMAYLDIKMESSK